MDKSQQFAIDNLAPSNSLAKAPTMEQYKKIMGPFWNYSINTILSLREFEIGFQAAAFLLNLTEHYKSQLTNKEYQINKYMLWYFCLRLLDKSDYWDDLISTLEKLELDPNIKLPDEMYPRTGSSHLTEHLYWRNRRKIVQRKIDRQKEGRSVKHLKHAQLDEMSNDEYKRRIRVLIHWFEYGQVAEAELREVYEERMKRTSD